MRQVEMKGSDGNVSRLEKMKALGCRHLPVVEQGQLLGMISLRDLLQIDSQRSRARAEFLRELVTYERDYES